MLPENPECIWLPNQFSVGSSAYSDLTGLPDHCLNSAMDYMGHEPAGPIRPSLGSNAAPLHLDQHWHMPQ